MEYIPQFYQIESRVFIGFAETILPRRKSFFELFRRLTPVPACALARQAGCAQIELVTNQRRAGAPRFYQREGMHSTHYGFTLPL